MISWLCGRRSVGNRRLWRSGASSPAARDLRRERGREPGVEDVGLAREAAGLVALRLVVARRRVERGIDRERLRVGEDRRVEVRRPVRLHPVPDRERHAEEALAAHAPVEVQVLGPVAVAHAHEVRVPGDAVARRDQLLLVLEEPHEPLARGDELERPVALLVELDRVLDRLRLRDERRLGGARSRSRRDRAAAPRSPSGRP